MADVGLTQYHLISYWARTFPNHFELVRITGAERFPSKIGFARVTDPLPATRAQGFRGFLLQPGKGRLSPLRFRTNERRRVWSTHGPRLIDRRPKNPGRVRTRVVHPDVASWVIRGPGRASSKSRHVRYAAESASKFRPLARQRRRIAGWWHCPRCDSGSETGASNHALRTQRLRMILDQADIEQAAPRARGWMTAASSMASVGSCDQVRHGVICG